jgi:AbiV family abortive infection protein
VKNAWDLVRDAEVLAQAHSMARAYSLAALAVEEVGKAASLSALATMPAALKARAPVGRMLEWHQLKQVTGQLVATVPFGPPGFAARLLAVPENDLPQILSALGMPAEEADRLKRGGLYVDIGRDGRIREPSEITETEVALQLARARLAACSATILLDQNEQARLLNPPEESVELSRAAADSIGRAGYDRTPDAAAYVIARMVNTLRKRMTGRSAPGALAA